MAGNRGLPRRRRVAVPTGERSALRQCRGNISDRGADRDIAGLAGEPVPQFGGSIGPAAAEHHDPGHAEQFGIFELHPR